MYKKLLYSEERVSLGLLIVRIGVGISFMVHGYPKLFLGGAAGLAKGLAATGIPGGIGAAYLAAAAEFFGGMALALGVLTIPTAMVMAFTMLVAVMFHLNSGHGFKDYSHPFEAGILFIALAVSGPGKFSLDRILFGAQKGERTIKRTGPVPVYRSAKQAA